MLSLAKITGLQEILKDEYGKDLSLAEASEIARGIVAYYDTLAKNYHKIKIENEYEKRAEKI